MTDERRTLTAVIDDAGDLLLDFTVRIVGDGQDPKGPDFALWIQEHYENALGAAALHKAVGIRLPRRAADVPVQETFVIPDDPTADHAPVTLRVIEREPSPEEIHETIAGQIGRLEANGQLTPTKPYPQRLAGNRLLRVETSLLKALEQHPLSLTDVCKLHPELSRWQMQSLLHKWLAEGRVSWSRGGTHPQCYQLMRPRESTDTPAEGHMSLLNLVVPHTKGLTFLMLGGRPNQAARRQVEGALQLRELRWPEFDEEDPIEWHLRQIAREDVDVVCVNRFNKRYSRHYCHAAQDAGKRLLVLSKGYGVMQTAEQVRKQWLEGARSAVAA